MNRQPRLVVLNATCLDILERHCNWIEQSGLELVADDSFRTLTPEQVDDALTGAFAAILPAAVRTAPSEPQMARASELRTLSIAASGYEWLDLDAATRQGIVVANASVPELAEAVADLAIGLMIASSRQIVDHHQRLVHGDKSRGMGTTLFRKTLGIIGLGSIGKAVARRARAFDMRILATTRNPDASFAARYRVEFMSLDDLLRQADYVSLHVRLTNHTRCMIGKRELALMRPSAFLINTARQELLDEAALTEAVLRGRIAGAGLDDPPLVPDSPLLRHANCVCTTHIGNRCAEAMDAVLRQAVENVLDVLHGRRTSFLLNPHVYERGLRPRD